MTSPEELSEEEKTLQFKHFANEDALVFANGAVAAAKKLGTKPITLRVELNGQVILEFWMTGRDHAGWLARKVHTVLETGHASLWTFQHQDEQPYHDWLKDETQAVCGGGFPLVIGGKLRGALAVSGLDHQDDHRVLVAALKATLAAQND